jgi:hypothetical protein
MAARQTGDNASFSEVRLAAPFHQQLLVKQKKKKKKKKKKKQKNKKKQ